MKELMNCIETVIRLYKMQEDFALEWMPYCYRDLLM